MKPLNAIGSVDGYQQVGWQAPPQKGPEKVGTGSAPNSADQKKGVEDGPVREITDRLNRMTNLFNRRIQFEVPFEVPVEREEVLVKIIDRETGQVIRQIPPAELVKLAERMEEIYGMIFRAKP